MFCKLKIVESDKMHWSDPENLLVKLLPYSHILKNIIYSFAMRGGLDETQND